jgi:GTP-binding protein
VLLRVAIIGKPNVGKSTLFNRLCGKRLAIVHDRPGVTRDTKEYIAKIGKFEFELIDTAGLDFESKDEIAKKMTEFAINAAKSADCLLLLIDYKNGVTGEDFEYCKKLRKLSKQIVLVANKAEAKNRGEVADFYKLGFGEPILISAEHGLGLDSLAAKLKEFVKKEEVVEEVLQQDGEEVEIEAEVEHKIKVSFLGRPNAGKSSLFNAILGFERSIVSEVAGTTRDAISYDVEYLDRKIEFIDTAGMRKKTNIHESLETLSVVESINALRRSNVILVVLDAQVPLEAQDIAIIRLAIEEGRALVIVVNKMDLIKDLKEYQKELEYKINDKLFEVKGVEIVFASAMKKKNIPAILKAIVDVEKIWMSQISTGQANKWLEGAVSLHIPPMAKNGRRIRFKYITQSAMKPPTFTIFCNIPADVPESYNRYLYNSLRETFGLWGTPIRLKFRKINNPYDKK